MLATTATVFYRTRRTLVIPNLLYRWEHARGHIFAGTGIGVEFGDSLTREDNFRADFTPVGWKEIEPRVFELEHADTRKVLFAPRVGFSVFPMEHLGIARRFLHGQLAHGHKNRCWNSLLIDPDSERSSFATNPVSVR